MDIAVTPYEAQKVDIGWVSDHLALVPIGSLEMIYVFRNNMEGTRTLIYHVRGDSIHAWRHNQIMARKK